MKMCEEIEYGRVADMPRFWNFRYAYAMYNHWAFNFGYCYSATEAYAESTDMNVWI